MGVKELPLRHNRNRVYLVLRVVNKPTFTYKVKVHFYPYIYIYIYIDKCGVLILKETLGRKCCLPYRVLSRLNNGVIR